MGSGVRRGAFPGVLNTIFMEKAVVIFSSFIVLAGFATHSWAESNVISEGDVASKPPAIPKSLSSDKNEFAREGLSVEFMAIPYDDPKNGKTKNLVEGRTAKIRFTIKDKSTGTPVRGLYPAAWMDRQGEESKRLSCKDKIGSFLQARLAFRPTNDLNAWYLLAMNEKASISVLDPLVDAGASQMMLDLIILDSPGEAWSLNRSADKLFVTLPDTDKIAVVNTSTWDVVTYLKAGSRPVQIAFQPDQKYLWVGMDGGLDGKGNDGGVMVIDPETHQAVAKIQTGKGHHEIAFSDDSRFAYITNEQDGTVSVIDVWKLEKVKDIQTGQRPASIAYSSTANSLFVVDSATGIIHVIEGKTHETLSTIETDEGSSGLVFAPDGRWGFVTNPVSKKVMILDASVNRIAKSFEIGKGPHQIVFSDNNAFVHSMGSATISVIERNSLNKQGPIPVMEIPVGKSNPDKIRPARANAISLTPEEASVVIANPNAESIFYYMEGMNAPMGTFGNFKRRPKAVLSVDKGLRETTPGVYEADVRLAKPGDYDVAFFLDSPQITHCFTETVAADPALRAKENSGIKLDFLTKEKYVGVGGSTEVRIKLTDLAGKPKEGVKDLMVSAIAMGSWQKRIFAESVKDGEYVARFSFPKPGVYMVFFSSHSLKATHAKWPRLVLHAKKDRLSKRSDSKTDSRPPK